MPKGHKLPQLTPMELLGLPPMCSDCTRNLLIALGVVPMAKGVELRGKRQTEKVKTLVAAKLQTDQQYTVPEAAMLMSVNRQTVYKWIQNQTIRALATRNRYLIPGSELSKLIRFAA